MTPCTCCRGFISDRVAGIGLQSMGDGTYVELVNCPGCPTAVGPDKLLERIRALTEFRVDTIHLANCIEALCPFREKYLKALAETFPGVDVVVGTHEEHIDDDEFRRRVKGLFCQRKKTMVDMILDRD